MNMKEQTYCIIYSNFFGSTLKVAKKLTLKQVKKVKSLLPPWIDYEWYSVEKEPYQFDRIVREELLDLKKYNIK